MKEDLEKIKVESEYCLNCKNKPCKNGCPLQNNIPDFIKYIKEEKYTEAYKILNETTIFETICGRICPHKIQCEGNCIRAIKGQSVEIGDLEAFIGDYALKNIDDEKVFCTKKGKIAIVGSGPAGIACTYYLSHAGYHVDIYEKHEKIGGLLRHGIPDFRLSKELLDEWLDKYILNSNVSVYNNMALGKDFTLEELKAKYDKIILAFGANVSNKMNVEGENHNFVIGGNELLEYNMITNFEGKIVAVIGGGNVAMDVSRTVKKLGAKESIVIYRRAEEQMPAESKEIEDAKKEGVKFLFQTNITKILDNKIECVKTELVKKEGESRLSPVDIEGSNFIITTDYVVSAVGSGVEKSIIDNIKLNVDKWGYIEVNENYETSDSKVYAIGDLIGEKKTVAWAVRSGIKCAKKIIKE